jgi:hypothetical protein
MLWIECPRNKKRFLWFEWLGGHHWEIESVEYDYPDGWKVRRHCPLCNIRRTIRKQSIMDLEPEEYELVVKEEDND